MRNPTHPEVNVRIAVMDICEATDLQEKEVFKTLCDRLTQSYISRRNTEPLYLRHGEHYRLKLRYAEHYLNAIKDGGLHWDYPVDEVIDDLNRRIEVSIPFEQFNFLLQDLRELLDVIFDFEKLGLLDKWRYGVEYNEDRIFPGNEANIEERRLIPIQESQRKDGRYSPGDLCVIVDNINEQVSVSAHQGERKPTTYSRSDVVGKGTVTWPLLVDFAKCKGSLEGNTKTDVKERNTSANRKNLGNKLMEALGLDRSPFIEKRNGAMRFASISLAGGRATSDAFDRSKVSFDDQSTEFLVSRGEDMPVD